MHLGVEIVSTHFSLKIVLVILDSKWNKDYIGQQNWDVYLVRNSMEMILCGDQLAKFLGLF